MNSLREDARGGADGRTYPGKDFSHGVSLCGLGLCDCQVLGLLQPSGVQVFPLLELLASSEPLRLVGTSAQSCGFPVCVQGFLFIAVFTFSKRLQNVYLPLEEN